MDTLACCRYDSYIYGQELSAKGGSVALPAGVKGWGVRFNNHLLMPATVPTIESTVQGLPVVSMSYTFANAVGLETAPRIPSTVKRIVGTFKDCGALRGELYVDSTQLLAYTDCLAGAVVTPSTSLVVKGSDIFAIMGVAGTCTSGQTTHEYE